MRLILALLFALGFQVQAIAGEVCPGTSLLPELQRSRPEAWRQAIAALDRIPNSEGLFWKIEAEGAKPSWLLGTMHVPDPRITAFRPAVAEALAAAGVLVLELSEPPGEQDAKLVEALLPLARLPEGEAFDADFTDEQKKALGELTQAVGMPYFMARRMRPWFVAIAVSIPLCIQLALMRGEPGVDGRLQELATAAGKPVLGLETIEEQVAALASLDGAVGPEGLIELISQEIGSIDDLLATGIDAYLQEKPGLDLQLMLAMPEFRHSAEMFRLIEGPLLHDRNLRMRDRLLPMLKDGNAFIGVGALHLVGETGLVELLRERGFAVTRVP